MASETEIYTTKRLNKKQRKLYNECLKILRRGGTLNLWRGSSPHNLWIESKTGRARLSGYHFGAGDGLVWPLLKQKCKIISEKGRVHYPGIFRGSDHGQAEHTIWAYDDQTED